ncbi:uncharacterized protein LOC131689556 [Topomyia yanbarensis]|uniref:uncharacterized protein LOC131689556 n=1 Tax=Topomyia yanbarensis TaxID=2498891 RepID=UPI00273B93DD|nr:uncharacterized protein LOC131689556 [Topomyia yanbarensis]
MPKRFCADLRIRFLWNNSTKGYDVAAVTVSPIIRLLPTPRSDERWGMFSTTWRRKFSAEEMLPDFADLVSGLFFDDLIEIGCADGRLKFWEGTTGNFKDIYEAENTHNNGVTNINLAGDKVIVARLSERNDFLRLETYT